MNSEWINCTCNECGFIWTFNYFWEDCFACPKCLSARIEKEEDKDDYTK